MDPESSEWSERMVKLILDVSDDLPDEAKTLLESDNQSLERYLSSSAFMDDLLSEQKPLDVDAEIFFAILFKQFQRRIEQDDGFRERFRSLLDEAPGSDWTIDHTRDFFEDEELIQYLVDMLQRFMKTEEVYQLPGQTDEECRYIFEMLDAAADADRSQTFQIFCHIGNYSLYLTGVFPDWLQHRHRYKNRPVDINSYRNFGKAYFERAANHELARKRRLTPILTKLHNGYDLVRTSLNIIFTEISPAFQS